ncbi:MAG: hypothetical protein UW14_C0021G0002 [Candidatus Yanofskybacteria bacterium GW2011_GWA2_44_10]|uniref:Uncharacterized protein n=1 Tax=Candidatus Yanofskybacteria bacterium GW2011_GWB1_45_11 TaxID=1619026 RepID=A0A0G1NZU8_9BACT|nr:MAG: hypothetical protein UW14_C0021G0002 [Candidatus Yanofskybacteria bacterium GW2011_GWA2_44_10]KKT89614.1 MAG: hypothetical protein UW90_C0015G0002 [Candidatus Yanofskybacteria bacterium GW2011_GWB1_45_11]
MMEMEYWILQIVAKLNGFISSEPNHTRRFVPKVREEIIKTEKKEKDKSEKPAT